MTTIRYHHDQTLTNQTQNPQPPGSASLVKKHPLLSKEHKTKLCTEKPRAEERKENQNKCLNFSVYFIQGNVHFSS